jgi:arylsulfatase A-like enzyme
MMRPSAVLVGLALLVSACGSAAPPRPPNVLVLVLDTLRADRLGAYGNTRGLTPFLDSLAARDVVFRHAYAASSWTMPSVASLLTSRFPAQHGVIQITSVLPDSEITLPEVLAAHGFATAAFSANRTIAPGRGFGQGYQRAEGWDAMPLARATTRRLDGSGAFDVPPRADFVNRAALEWLDGLGHDPARRPPVFLYLQYMETHHPFTPPAETLARLRGDRPYPQLSGVNGAMLVQPWMPIAMNDELLAGIRDTYDAEVATLDAELRELFAGLEARGVLDHAVVVVVADHGDELWEHEALSHGHTLYEELIHVPLIIGAPGARFHGQVDDVVSLVDVAPTILALVGVPIPPEFEGRSLVPWLEGGSRPQSGVSPRNACSELLPHNEQTRRLGERRAVVAGRLKLIAGPGDQRTFYDLAADPAEQHPLSAVDDSGLLVGALEQAVARAQRTATTPKREPLDEESRARLRALGYAE